MYYGSFPLFFFSYILISTARLINLLLTRPNEQRWYLCKHTCLYDKNNTYFTETAHMIRITKFLLQKRHIMFFISHEVHKNLQSTGFLNTFYPYVFSWHTSSCEKVCLGIFLEDSLITDSIITFKMFKTFRLWQNRDIIFNQNIFQIIVFQIWNFPYQYKRTFSFKCSSKQ